MNLTDEEVELIRIALVKRTRYHRDRAYMMDEQGCEAHHAVREHALADKIDTLIEKFL